MGVVTNSIRHGRKSLDATLAYIDLRRKAQPELVKVLDLYAAIFTIQDRYYEGFVPGSHSGPPSKDSGKPALVGAVPGLQLADVQRVLKEISEAVAAAAPERQSELESSITPHEGERGDLARLVAEASDPDSSSPSATRTLFLLSLNPFYERFAAEMVPSVAETEWQFGHCPICGERPAIAKYEQSVGTRFLQCNLCRTQWAQDRILCPFCGNRDQDSLGYLSDAPDSAFRVEVCDACRHYIKAVDERALQREVILHVEELTISFLDHEALTRGYQP